MRIIKILPGDYVELAELLHSHFLMDTRESWLNRFASWWDHNPYFKETTTRGWGIVDDDKLVGFLGNIPFPIQVGGQLTVAFASTSWFVKAEYRVAGNSLALLCEQMESSQNSILFNTTASVEVAAILERLRFTKLDLQSTILQSFYIHRPYSLLLPRLKKLRMSLFAYPLSFFLNLLQALRVKSFNNNQFSIKEVTHCGPDFDELWASTRNEFPTTVERSSLALNWYCFSNRELRKRILGIYKQGILRAFVILGFRQSEGYMTCDCLDLWGGDESDKLALLNASIELARKDGGAVIQFNHFDEPTASLVKKLNLFKRRITAPSRYFLTGGRIDPQTLLENSFFGLNLGDHGL